MDLEFSDRALSGCTVIELHGELDLTTAPALRERVLETLTAHTTRPAALVLDLSALALMDSAGLQALLAANRHAALLGTTLALAAPQKIVATVLRISGLAGHFTIHPTAEAAITAAVGTAGATPADQDQGGPESTPA